MKTRLITLGEMKPAEKINADFGSLPIAESCQVIVNNNEVKQYKATVVNGQVIDIPSRHYHIVQHGEAFKPVIEALTLTGTDFKYQLFNTQKKAVLRILTSTVNDGQSNIMFGFQITNSFDRSTTVNYGINISRGQQYIEVVGYRQVCSNGLKIRVPLSEAEFVGEETRARIKELMSHSAQFKHMAGVNQKIEGMQYVVEAIALLKEPLQAMINKAQNTKLDEEKILELVKKHFSKRMSEKILNRFNQDIDVEGNDAWALYNAVTYEASHDVSLRQHEDSLTRANKILMEAITG